MTAGVRPDGVAEDSTFFSVADVEVSSTVATASDGDLWPTTWADDGHVYTACGDGLGFDLSGSWADIVVNRIEGTPVTGLSGTRLASGRDVSPVWTDPARYNSKPTGIVAVDGNRDGRDELYLAVQDLRCGDGPSAFNEAPAAGIVRSDDYGRIWHAPDAPQFTDHEFTTVMFLDLGRSNEHAKRLEPGHVYAFGLDHNWRASYDGCVPDPTHLYLARAPVDGIQDRSRWQFFGGNGVGGRPAWSSRLADREPVLIDATRRHEGLVVAGPAGVTVISQGGVVYDAGLERYLYTSWSEYTFELYEAPQPWGPWRRALSRDFGPYPWVGPDGAAPRHGGYGTTLPSKFISSDGRDAWLQSNWFWRASTFEGRTYHFSLRRLRLDPAIGDTDPDPQPPAGTNLAAPERGARPIATACRCGRLQVLNDGDRSVGDDSWNGMTKTADFWGYTWARPLRMNRLVYVSGPYDFNGGWFERPPGVQVRVRGRWVDVLSSTTPGYAPGPGATGRREYVLAFDAVTTDGVRLVGPPGGVEHYSAISELEVRLIA